MKKQYRNLLLIVIFVVAFALLFSSNLLSTIPSAGVITDSALENPERFWSESNWSIHKNASFHYNYSVKGQVTMMVDVPVSFRYGGVGLYQGQKPFGWGNASYVFPKLRIDDEKVVLTWRGRLNSFQLYGTPLTSQVNLGVDLWIEIDTAEGVKTGEIYVFFYQEGVTTMPVGYRQMVARSEKEGNWLYLQAHHSQLIKEQMTKYTVDLAELAAYYKRSSHDTAIQNGQVWLTGVDCHMEAHFAKAEYTLDYCAVG